MSNLNQQSQPPQAAVDQIIGLYNQGQLKQTVLLSESLAKQYPNALILYDILGAAYMGLNNNEKSIEIYQKALQLNPNHIDAYNNIGLALYEQGRFNAAVEIYQKAIEIEPSFADVHYNLGNSLKQNGNLKKAIQSYQASLRIEPDDPEVLLNYSNALRSYGDFDRAIENYTKALKIEPHLAGAQQNKDQAVEEKSVINDLVLNLAGIAKLEVGSAGFANCTGNILEGRGYLDAAMESFKRALEINPNYAEAYYSMGMNLKNRGEFDAALDCYKQAIKIQPDYVEVYRNIGNILQSKGEFEAAIDCYKQILKLMPNDAQAYKAMGNVLMENRDPVSAISCYEEAIKLFSENVDEIKKIQPKLLVALFSVDDKYRVCKKLDELISLGHNNATIGSYASRAALRYDIDIDNPFCNQPLDYVLEKSLLKLCNFDEFFVKPSVKVLGFETVSLRKQELLIKGSQTAGNIFETENYFARQVQEFIRIEIKKYRDNFEGSSEGLILDWPSDYTLSGWLVSMKSGGAIRPHMHENGWISGSIYINVPKSQIKDSGNLVVCVNTTNENQEYKQIINVNTGSLCLFPSSLLHYTFPFDSTEDRIVLAFDAVPK